MKKVKYIKELVDTDVNFWKFSYKTLVNDNVVCEIIVKLEYSVDPDTRISYGIEGPNYMWICSSETKEKYCNKGYYTRLLKKVLESAQLIRCDVASLSRNIEWHENLYKKLGFSVTKLPYFRKNNYYSSLILYKYKK